MSMIDSLPAFQNRQDNSRLQEAKVSFQGLLQEMEEDYLKQQPHNMASPATRSPVDEEHLPKPTPVTETQVAERVVLAKNQVPKTPKPPEHEMHGSVNVGVSNPITETSKAHAFNSVAGLTAKTEPTQTADSRVVKSELQPLRNTELLNPLTQSAVLENHGVHFYLTQAGLGLSYRNAELHTPSALEQVLEIKKLLTAQGKIVTEAYVNAQRIEFKGTKNGY